MTATVAEVIGAIPTELVLEVVGPTDVPVVDLTHDSRSVVPGGGFACVPGARHDGHDHAVAAVAAGAVLVLVERELPLVGVTQLVVRNARRAMGHAAAVVHGRPGDALVLVGVTGTNGKTTTTQLLGSILAAQGREVRVLGTLAGTRTTPEATDLQRRFAEFVTEGVDAVVMEVSSHALALHRVAGTRFDVAVFTNLGRDHLDLHGTLEEYFRAKASLFTPELADRGVANLDDPHGRLLVEAAGIPMAGFGSADASDVVVGAAAIAFTWRDVAVRVPIGGDFNVLNSLAALTAAESLGITPADAATGIARARTVPGRFEVVSPPGAPVTVIVDYAHTPEGIEQVLRSARAIADGRVVVVFGCGGDRDPDKRPLMGAAAAAGADVVVVTSDNPRSEAPEAIAASIIGGIDDRYRDAVRTELDRRAAITLAIDTATSGDVVVIAGKGHETTQTVGGRDFPFDDREVARSVLVARTPGVDA